MRLVEIVLASVMVVLPLWTLFLRLRKRPPDDNFPQGLGARFIQLMAVFIIIPLVGILTLEGKISGETAAALIGVALGYTLSGVERPVPRQAGKS